MKHPKGRAEVVSGVRYRSGFEAGIARDLLSRGYSPHYEEIRLLYEVPHVYVLDFAPRKADGEKVLVEAKGYFPAPQRQKMVEVQRAHPELDVRLLFQRAANRIGSGSKTTYGQWATRAGFTWAEGDHVPEEWLEG